MKISKNEKINKIFNKYGITVAAILILLMIILQMFLPSAKKIKELSDKVFEERTRLEELYLKGKSLKKSKQEYLDIKEKVAQLDKVFLKANKELELITQLEKIATKNSITQHINLGTKKIKHTNNIDKIKISISLQGQYYSILNYLQDIEALDYYVLLDDFSLGLSQETKYSTSQTKKINDQQNPNLNATLNGYILYWQNQNN